MSTRAASTDRSAAARAGWSWPMRPAIVLFALLFGSTAMAVEEPPFDLVVSERAFSIRDYHAQVVAEVTVSGDQKTAANSGFRLLAGYIFGGNRRRDRIAMTAPVAQQPAGERIAMTAPVMQRPEGGAWRVRFTMPRTATLETLPEPNDPRVELHAVPAARIAVVRFSGLARTGDVAARTRELEQWIASRQLRVAGPASLARYDPPWTPWFMRRNEVMIAIQP